MNLGISYDNILKHIISKQDVLLAIHNFRELKSLANNAKIRSLLKFQLIKIPVDCKPEFLFQKPNMVFVNFRENIPLHPPINYFACIFRQSSRQ